MVIAVLALVGVDLIVIVALVVAMLMRRRWVSHQPGAFPVAVRVAAGEFSGVGTTWQRGYGRWVGEVLIWTRAPLLMRHSFVDSEGIEPVPPESSPLVKRLGETPYVVSILASGTRLEVAARAEDDVLLLNAISR